MADYGIEIAAKTLASIERTCRRTAMEIYRRVIFRTPVKTGRARGNWFCTLGTGTNRTTEATGEASARFQEVAQEAKAWDPLSESPIFLSNNLPYIVPLETGSSKQAPNGMVGITIAEVGGILQEPEQGWAADL